MEPNKDPSIEKEYESDSESTVLTEIVDDPHRDTAILLIDTHGEMLSKRDQDDNLDVSKFTIPTGIEVIKITVSAFGVCNYSSRKSLNKYDDLIELHLNSLVNLQ